MSSQSSEVYVAPPRWLIRHLCYADGSWRLPPLPQRDVYSGRYRGPVNVCGYESGRFDYNHGWGTSCDNRLPRHYAARPGPVTIQRGNMEMMDYAFYCGSKYNGSWRQCRWCMTSLYTDVLTLEHKRRDDRDLGKSHAKLLQWMGKLLSARAECVSCGESNCTHRRWGYPICFKQRCIDDFMFYPLAMQSQRWIEAKRVIIDELHGPASQRVICL